MNESNTSALTLAATALSIVGAAAFLSALHLTGPLYAAAVAVGAASLAGSLLTSLVVEQAERRDRLQVRDDWWTEIDETEPAAIETPAAARYRDNEVIKERWITSVMAEPKTGRTLH